MFIWPGVGTHHPGPIQAPKHSHLLREHLLRGLPSNWTAHCPAQPHHSSHPSSFRARALLPKYKQHPGKGGNERSGQEPGERGRVVESAQGVGETGCRIICPEDHVT